MSPRPRFYDPHATNAPRPKMSRVFGELHGYAVPLVVILVLNALSVAANVSAPHLLGKATNVIFAGVLGRHLPEGTSISTLVAHLRAKGNHRLADMLQASHAVPGKGIDFAMLGHYVLLVLGLYAASALFMYIAGRIVRRVVQSLGYRLRKDCARKIDSLTLSYVDSHERGDILSRVSNDVDNLTQSLQQTISQMFTAILQLVGISAMMLWISWKLALIALIVVPVGAACAGIVMKKSQPHFARQWGATGSVSATVEEAFTGSQVVALYGLEDAFNEKFDQHNDSLRRASFTANFMSSLLQPMMSFVGNLSYVIVAVGGGIMVAHGTLTLGGVQAFIQYSRQLGQPLGQLSGIATMLQSATASAGRIFEFLDTEDTLPVDAVPADEARASRSKDSDEGACGASEASPAAAAIEFRNVCFSYIPGTPVIRNLSLKVAHGQQVAIVGPTGAGKTTLVNLLMRFYEVDSGAILLDGADIRSMTRDALRSRIGMVLQDTWLFEGTIADNIAFGASNPSRAAIKDAARAADAHHLISRLPEGYDTLVAESGEGLSRGEKQLLTIARAFISQPDILILDEATSSVDTRTEMLIGKAMGKLRKGRTGFIIAHRLSTIRDADLIIVMDGGDVVEQGTHDSLLAAKGRYAELYRSQFEGPSSS